MIFIKNSKKKIALVVSIVSVSVFFACGMAAIYSNDFMKLVVDHLPTFISIIATLFVVGVISFFISDLYLGYLKYNLKKVRCVKNLKLKHITGLTNEVTTELNNFSKAFEVQQSKFDDLINCDDPFIDQKLKDILFELKNLYKYSFDICKHMSRNLIGYTIGQSIDIFRIDDFLNAFDQKLEWINDIMVDSAAKLSSNYGKICGVLRKIDDRIMELKAHPEAQEVAAKLKRCIDSAELDLCGEKLNPLMSDCMTEVDLLRDYALKIQDLIKKITAQENPQSVSSEPDVVSCSEKSSEKSI